MAAVRLHNALFMPASPGAMSFSSRSSIATSGAMSSDMLSTGQFVTSQQISPVRPKQPGTGGGLFRRSSRTWFYATLGLSFALVVWVIYCTVRYFVALRIYSGDTIRSRYALGMGITSTFAIVFFANNSLLILWFADDLFRRRIILIFSLFTYFSSALVISVAAINLSLVIRWRVPHSPAESSRSVQGRCNWDVDVVWSGTGGACDASEAMPFGDWLGAAIFRLVVTAVVLVAYHLAVHGHLAASRSHETLPAMIFAGSSDHGQATFRSSTTEDLRPFGRSGEPPETGTVGTVKRNSTYDAEPPPRPLSFAEAGQVLSRIEGSDADDGDIQSSSSSSSYSSHDLNEAEDRSQSRNRYVVPLTRSDSPEPIPRSAVSQQLSHASTHRYTAMDALPPNPPPSSFHRPVTVSTNDLQDFASAFRSLVSRISRDTQEGMTLDDIPEYPALPRENDTVRVLGSYISRMSTIDSMASREVSNSVRSPSRSDTGPSVPSGSPVSSHPGSRNLSRNPTLNRGRDLDEAERPPSTSPEI